MLMPATQTRDEIDAVTAASAGDDDDDADEILYARSLSRLFLLRIDECDGPDVVAALDDDDDDDDDDCSSIGSTYSRCSDCFVFTIASIVGILTTDADVDDGAATISSIDDDADESNSTPMDDDGDDDADADADNCALTIDCAFIANNDELRSSTRDCSTRLASPSRRSARRLDMTRRYAASVGDIVIDAHASISDDRR